MAIHLGKFIFILLLVLPALILLTQNDGFGSLVAYANEDETENEPTNVNEDTYDEEEDEEETTIEDDSVEPNTDDKEEEKEDEDGKFSTKASSDAVTHLLFTTPTDLKFIAGETVQFLTGFQNNGDSDFVVDYIEASFRYPQDFNYFIQNFTVMSYNTVIKPNKQATFEYTFKPSDTFNSRPFGLTINMKYHNLDGKDFIDAVFNETVHIQEPDDGFDGEAFFLYLIMAAIVALLSLGAHHLFNSYGRKHLPKKVRSTVEMGTSKNNVDYDWLPKHATQNKSPKSSPKQSPRQKKSKAE